MEIERERFIDNQIDDRRSVSTTPLQGDTAAGHSWPSMGGEYYTLTQREEDVFEGEVCNLWLELHKQFRWTST